MYNRHRNTPFLLDTIYNLTMVTPMVRVLNALWNKPPLAKCSSDTFKSVSPYTLWLSTKAMCKAFQLPDGYLGRRCNGDNRAANILAVFKQELLELERKISKSRKEFRNNVGSSVKRTMFSGIRSF